MAREGGERDKSASDTTGSHPDPQTRPRFPLLVCLQTFRWGKGRRSVWLGRFRGLRASLPPPSRGEPPRQGRAPFSSPTPPPKRKTPAEQSWAIKQLQSLALPAWKLNFKRCKRERAETHTRTHARSLARSRTDGRTGESSRCLDNASSAPGAVPVKVYRFKRSKATAPPPPRLYTLTSQICASGSFPAGLQLAGRNSPISSQVKPRPVGRGGIAFRGSVRGS